MTLYNTTQNSTTLQNNTITIQSLYNTTQHCKTQGNPILYHITIKKHYIPLHNTIQQCTTLNNTIKHNTTLNSTTQHYKTLHNGTINYKANKTNRYRVLFLGLSNFSFRAG